MQADKNKILEEIFTNDPFGLLNVKASSSASYSADERLLKSFREINAFIENNKREPEPGNGTQEYILYSRLKSIRGNKEKSESLKPFDSYNLLEYAKKEINSIEDIL
ncbi:MAG TPA: GIY-YIG nuclease family protein, partial [Bacteroidia bacterium]